jgi:sugar-specific transcriptional regulator TrmB
MLHAMPRRGRPRKARPAEPMAELERFAKRYRPRAEKLERELDELRAERDRAIRTAAACGVPVVEIARALDLHHQRVSQILRGE